LLIHFSRSGDLDPGIGSLHIAVRRVLSIGPGTGFPGNHTTLRLLESVGTHRKEDYGSEEYMSDTDRDLRPDCRYLHESSRNHQEVLIMKYSKSCATKLWGGEVTEEKTEVNRNLSSREKTTT